MAFNPFKKFPKSDHDNTPDTTEKVSTGATKTKSMPVRGPGGKFVSTKPKVKEEVKPEVVETKETTVTGPFPVTFNGHIVNRYYKDGVWYFSLDDIAHCSYINPDDPRIGNGDPKKLAEAIKKCETKIDGISVAEPREIAKFIPYFKGTMPGPIVDWLNINADAPVPQEEIISNLPQKPSAPMNPSEASN
jgi:hypothetical protein